MDSPAIAKSKTRRPSDPFHWFFAELPQDCDANRLSLLAMNALPLAPWNNLSEDRCGSMTVTCGESGDGLPGPDAFRWYEQDSSDELADQALAWASTEEAVSLRAEERLVHDLLIERG